MKRREFLTAAGAAALSMAVAKPALAQSATVRWWYHFDNPQATPADLVARFEREKPGIKIQAESIPWGGGSGCSRRLSPATLRTAPWCACPGWRAFWRCARWTR